MQKVYNHSSSVNFVDYKYHKLSYFHYIRSKSDHQQSIISTTNVKQPVSDYYKQFIDAYLYIQECQPTIKEQIKYKQIFIEQSIKNTLIFDLDETLLHSTPSQIILRPMLIECLNELSKYYNLWVWTASMKEYAMPLISKHMGTVIEKVLYRENCVELSENVFIKDLRVLSGCDYRKYAIIDNHFMSFITFPSNGYLCDTFEGDLGDRELIDICKFFVELKDYDDLQGKLKEVLKVEQTIKELITCADCTTVK